jgi:hypothetical protein
VWIRFKSLISLIGRPAWFCKRKWICSQNAASSKIRHPIAVLLAEGLLAIQSEALETALWNAFRALERNTLLVRRLAARVRQNNPTPAAENFETRARSAEEQAQLIHDLLLSGKMSGTPDSAKNS